MFSIRKFFSPDRSNHKLRDKQSRENRYDRSARKFARKFVWFKNLKHLVIKMLRGDRRVWRSQGFTLIELLIAMLITTVIISTLLSFTVNIMESDRIEQAKTESQGEVQTALNYISDDLQEAVYIYNADALGTDSPNGIRDQLPTPLTNPIFANSTPILVFWKRVYYGPTDSLSVDPANLSTKKQVGCLEYGTSTSNTAPPVAPALAAFNASCPFSTASDGTLTPQGSGKYTYSLVAYYLIYDGATTWSKAARVGRWELKDGIRANCQLSAIATCTEPKPVQKIDLNADGSSFVNYWTVPDAGFKPFSSSGGDVATLMRQWTKTATAYDPTNTPIVLIDFIDDTPYVSAQDDGVAGNSPADIAIRANNTSVTPYTNPDCFNENFGVGGSSSAAAQRIPSAFNASSTNKAETLSSFYVCVNSTQTVARIYLRGNALARLRPNQLETERKVSLQTNTYLSTGNVRAYGRGKLNFQ